MENSQEEETFLLAQKLEARRLAVEPPDWCEKLGWNQRVHLRKPQLLLLRGLGVSKLLLLIRGGVDGVWLEDGFGCGAGGCRC